MKKITGVLVAEGNAKVIETEDKLDSYYELLGCDLIDIVTKKIDGEYFDIVCDEEGIFKEKIEVGMVNEHDGTIMLVGRLFVCKHDGKGGLKSLTENDVEKVLRNFIGGVVWGDF